MLYLSKTRIILILSLIICLLSLGFFLLVRFSQNEANSYFGSNIFGSGFWLSPDNKNPADLNIRDNHAGDLESMTDIEGGVQFQLLDLGLDGNGSKLYEVDVYESEYDPLKSKLYYFDKGQMVSNDYTFDSFIEMIKVMPKAKRDTATVDISILEDYHTSERYIDTLIIFTE